jgi:hypothetical protein
MALRKPACIGALALMAACASQTWIVFPDSIAFGGQTLNRATDWKRDGMQAIVYVPPGERLPRATPQIGVILSSTHSTAKALHDWVSEQSMRAGPPNYSTGDAGAFCKVAVTHLPDGPRTYISLQVCKTGVARAVCVEADETLDASEFTSCLGSGGCPEVCDVRWAQRREALDLLAADFITRR